MEIHDKILLTKKIVAYITLVAIDDLKVLDNGLPTDTHDAHAEHEHSPQVIIRKEGIKDSISK